MGEVIAFPGPRRSDKRDRPAPRAAGLRHDPEPLWRTVIGDQLRAARVDRGERIADVAERAGISPQYLSEIERGRKDPSSEMLAAVSGALGLTVPELARRAAGRYFVISETRAAPSRPSPSAPTRTDPLCLAA